MLLSTKEILLPLIAVILVVGPLWILLRKGINTTNAKTRILAQVGISDTVEADEILSCIIVPSSLIYCFS